MNVQMTDEALIDEIYVYIKKELNHSNDFDISTNVVKKGLVDSLGVLELISFLEKRYRVEIAFEDINHDNFQNVGAIARYVKKLLGRSVIANDTTNAPVQRETPIRQKTDDETYKGDFIGM